MLEVLKIKDILQDSGVQLVMVYNGNAILADYDDNGVPCQRVVPCDMQAVLNYLNN